jgi:hypothetical protein
MFHVGVIASMKRRTFFGALTVKTLAVVGVAQALCMRVAEAADSWFYWPSYPSTEALRSHIPTSSKHPEFKNLRKLFRR